MPPATAAASAGGASPRARGNPERGGGRPRARGCIPACAGEPCPGAEPRPRGTVHPRVRGGTSGRMTSTQPPKGASPRARGNHLRRSMVPSPERCIPACAGEPGTSGPSPRSPRVHPRVRGGTNGLALAIFWTQGASPRARGNLAHRERLGGGTGCIPACAGEPSRSSSACPPRRVHPRVRGGTGSSPTVALQRSGASPRARGNPTKQSLLWRLPWVHPRVRGGTDSLGTLTPDGWGASPRARGNRMPATSAPFQVGCIPACAGEPAAEVQAGPAVGVHPRVRGGTSSGAAP